MLTIDFSHFKPSESHSPIRASNISGWPLAGRSSFCGHRVFTFRTKGLRNSRKEIPCHLMMHTKQKVRKQTPIKPIQIGGDVVEEEEVGVGEAVDADAAAELLEEGNVEDMVRVELECAGPTAPLLREPNPNKSVKDTRSGSQWHQ